MVERAREPLLAARAIEKRFPGVRALRGVDLSVSSSEVVGVVGENGAGKSTLMRILAGVEAPDAGELAVDGRTVHFASVAAAQRAGIALIHQELSACERLDVTANIVLGREARRSFGRVDRAACEQRARAALERIGLDVDVRTPLEALSIGDRQRVEIAKALDARARVLIMDEPTSSLSSAEARRLFALVGELSAAGSAVLYISHRLGEIEALCDRAVVLRDGEVTGELPRGAIDRDALVRRMVGRDVSQYFSRHPHEPGTEALRLEGLVTQAWPRSSVDLSVRAGEVVGLAGLVGAGRTELLRTVFGLERARAGRVSIGGRVLHAASSHTGPGCALAAGVAFVPEDRQREGLFEDASVARNLSIARLAHDARAGVVDRGRERRLVAELFQRVRIRAASSDVAAGTLSGGNQQKVVLGRAFACEPRVLLLDEPTRGVDVGAKAEIYELIDELARAGLAILFASSELEEILGLSDRCLVLAGGTIAGSLERAELSEETVMRLATRTVPAGGARG